MKKIMFNDKYHLTELTLSGAKTRTTQIPSSFQFLEDAVKTGWTNFVIVKNKLMCYNSKGNACIQKHLPYQVGEIVAVAQSYSDRCAEFGKSNSCEQCPMFDNYTEPCDEHPGYQNKMFVKADMMLHYIRITDMKVERLQDITEEDCIKEGIKGYMIEEKSGADVVFKSPGDEHTKRTCPREAFKDLINAASGKGTWESNPYVLAIYYEVGDEAQYHCWRYEDEE